MTPKEKAAVADRTANTLFAAFEQTECVDNNNFDFELGSLSLGALIGKYDHLLQTARPAVRLHFYETLYAILGSIAIEETEYETKH